jgi:hypothetical protein
MVLTSPFCPKDQSLNNINVLRSSNQKVEEAEIH